MRTQLRMSVKSLHLHIVFPYTQGKFIGKGYALLFDEGVAVGFRDK
jgi:hypothetical protein